MQLGDARSGKFSDNLTGFVRALRRAGVPADSARIALAQQAAMLVGLHDKHDLRAALETVLVSQEQDRQVFRELFDVYFQNPDIEKKLLAQMLPRGQGKPDAPQRRPRVSDALRAPSPPGTQGAESAIRLDAAMSASRMERLRQADFNQLSAAEYQRVDQLARTIALPLPMLLTRRYRAGCRGHQLHWPAIAGRAVRHAGELIQLPRRERRRAPAPLLVLIDISGSMERYTRLLLAFLHTATRRYRHRDVFAFGTGLTDLTTAFRQADTDAMLAQVANLVRDYAGGTRLGDALHSLHRHHARRLTGRRTVTLLITDGLDTGDPEPLERELCWLRHASRRLLWLNPLLRYAGYQPLARGAGPLFRQSHAMLAVHNLEKLEDLATGLATIMRS
ncbi:MAG: VWA domain-containing protein [Burkholderiaceae bacterium]